MRERAGRRRVDAAARRPRRRSRACSSPARRARRRTGVDEIGKELNHAWFVGFAPAERPEDRRRRDDRVRRPRLRAPRAIASKIIEHYLKVGAPSQPRQRWTADDRAQVGRATIRWSIDRAAAVGLRHRHGVLAPARRTSRRAVAGGVEAQLVWFGARGRRRRSSSSRCSVRLIDWLTVPAYLLGDRAARGDCSSFGTGAGTAASMKGWLTIGGVRLGQPSELAKLTVVLMLAKVLASFEEPPQVAARAVEAGAGRRLSRGCSSWLQPDLGTGIVFIGIFFAMLFWSGVSWPLLLLRRQPGRQPDPRLQHAGRGARGSCCSRARALVQAVPRRGVVARLANVVIGVAGADPLGQARAVPAEAPARVPRPGSIDPPRRGLPRAAVADRDRLGRLVRARASREGPQKRLAFLPEQHTDFIFAVVGEELGFIGVTLALTLFLLLFLRVIADRRRAPTTPSAASSPSACWRAGSCTCS